MIKGQQYGNHCHSYFHCTIIRVLQNCRGELQMQPSFQNILQVFIPRLAWQDKHTLHFKRTHLIRHNQTTIIKLNAFCHTPGCIPPGHHTDSLKMEDKVCVFLKVTLCNNFTLFEIWFYRQVVEVPPQIHFDSIWSCERQINTCVFPTSHPGYALCSSVYKAGIPCRNGRKSLHSMTLPAILPKYTS